MTTTPLNVEPGEIAHFVRTMFRHASTGVVISLRTFLDNGQKDTSAIKIDTVRLNGSLDPVIQAAITQAQFAANYHLPAVFCPPIAGFRDETNAKEENLAEGYALSAECDQKPNEALQQLQKLLGPPTLGIFSGGHWTDAATGEVEWKVHLHWRLKKAATGEGLKKLKEARRLVAKLVGGDPTNVSIVHPIRWAGSWHRKADPHRAHIFTEGDIEVDLDTVLEVLRQAIPTDSSMGDQGDRSDTRPTAELIANIQTGQELHPSLVPLTARLIRGGVPPGLTVNLTRALMEAVPVDRRDLRWKARFDDIPRSVRTAQEMLGTKELNEIEPIDLWAQFEPPTLPPGVLPPILEEFAVVLGEMMGVDPSGLAGAVLAVCAAAIPDRIKVRVKVYDPGWHESARFWCAEVGEVSVLKSPIIETAAKPLRELDTQLFKQWQKEMAERASLPKEEQRLRHEPEQVRKRLEDATVESAQDVLEHSVDGLLFYRDELSGWLGGMEKYSNARAGAYDRAFYLQSYNGGEYAVNRVKSGRGPKLIPNLSLCVLGGIQSSVVSKYIHDTADDGLIQRFCPIVLKPSTLGHDRPIPDIVERYKNLIETLVQATTAEFLVNGEFCTLDILHLSPEAQLVRQRLEQRHHTLKGMETLNRKFASHIGKYNGLFARLCVLWHCIEHGGQNVPRMISAATAERVATFMHRFLLGHAFTFYVGILGLSSDHDRLSSVADYILAHRSETITSRDLQRGTHSMRDLDRTSTQLIFEQLEALGWLVAIPGRRANDPPLWLVNAKVHTRFANRAKQERERRIEVRTLIAELAKTDPIRS